jgi:2,3,4,5-tetrahydropyridine-2-carboxylate N-succinyltransferase
MNSSQERIEQAWEQRASLAPDRAPASLRDAIEETLAALDAGTLRVAEKRDGTWIVHQWIKKAVLLSFRLRDNAIMGGAAGDPLRFYDKVDTKFSSFDADRFRASGIRVVPPAVARRGAYIARNVVLMPSFVNIGAYVDE